MNKKSEKQTAQKQTKTQKQSFAKNVAQRKLENKAVTQNRRSETQKAIEVRAGKPKLQKESNT